MPSSSRGQTLRKSSQRRIGTIKGRKKTIQFSWEVTTSPLWREVPRWDLPVTHSLSSLTTNTPY